MRYNMKLSLCYNLMGNQQKIKNCSISSEEFKLSRIWRFLSLIARILGNVMSGSTCSSFFDWLLPAFSLINTDLIGILRDLGHLRCTFVVETVLACAKARDAGKTVLVADAVVLLARILPTIASFPFKWLLKYFPLGFACLDSWLLIIILAVFALADVWIALLGASKADAVHLPALTFGASTLLSRFS